MAKSKKETPRYKSIEPQVEERRVIRVVEKSPKPLKSANQRGPAKTSPKINKKSPWTSAKVVAVKRTSFKKPAWPAKPAVSEDSVPLNNAWATSYLLA